MIHERSNNEANIGKGDNKKRCMLAIKFAVGILFFFAVLLCTVFSKLTLISLTGQLHNVTYNLTEENSDDSKKEKAITLYWQLLLVIMIPNIVTFLRCLVFGVLGKTRKSYPWPKAQAAVIVSSKGVLFVNKT